MLFSCRQANEDATGCSHTTIIPAVNKLQTNVDADRELARIHALIIAHLDRLEDILSEYLEKFLIYYGLVCIIYPVIFNEVYNTLANPISVEFPAAHNDHAFFQLSNIFMYYC